MTDLASDVELINKRVGVTATELNHAREIAQTLRRQQEQAAKELAGQLLGLIKIVQALTHGISFHAPRIVWTCQQDREIVLGGSMSIQL